MWRLSGCPNDILHHEGTKDTKVSDIELLNFVLFVSFVVNISPQ